MTSQAFSTQSKLPKILVHHLHNCPIDWWPMMLPLYGSMYVLSPADLEVLSIFIKKAFATSSSRIYSHWSTYLLVKKKDGALWFSAYDKIRTEVKIQINDPHPMDLGTPKPKVLEISPYFKKTTGWTWRESLLECWNARMVPVILHKYRCATPFQYSLNWPKPAHDQSRKE